MNVDVVVVGAGIAGLTAALRMQRAGLSTVVVERSERAGGLCATVEEDGYEFSIGCNDFGTGFPRMLRELGVDAAFHHPRARFHFADHPLELPPARGTVAQLVLRTPAVVRAIYGARHVETLGELIDRHISDPWLADVACLPAFALVRSPDDVGLSAVRADFSKELAYGYDKSSTPVGGPRVLIEQMVARFTVLGGKLLLGRRFLQAIAVDGAHAVRTSHGDIRARAVMTSEGLRPPGASQPKPGLDVATVLLVVRADAVPAGYHTVDWFAPGVLGMLRALDAGERVERPSFHAFSSDLPIRDGNRTVTVFVPMARGDTDPPAHRQRALTEHVSRTLAEVEPRFARAIRRANVISPDAYQERFGLRPRPSAHVLPPATPKPPSYDAGRDVFVIGTSAGPPGEHAGAAALSGFRAAGEVIEKLERTTRRTPWATDTRASRTITT
jgi:phytoene dehydrogenase-like protein